MANPWDAYSVKSQDDQDPPDRGGHKGPGGDDPCPAGSTRYTQSDGSTACIPDGGPGNTNCPPGEEYSSSRQRCEPKCPDYQTRDYSGNCIDFGDPHDPKNQQPQSGGGGGGGTSTYKPPAYTPTKSPYDDALSKQLFDTLTGMINGGDAPFGPDTIARMQAAALQSNKSQLANSRTELQKRLINSGLSRSGVAPASYQKLESSAASDFSGNIRTIAVNAVQQNYNARVTALNQAQQFLQSERANALSQDQLILAYARLKQEWNTTQAQFDQQWKIVQNGNEQEMTKLMICLRTGVC